MSRRRERNTARAVALLLAGIFLGVVFGTLIAWRHASAAVPRAVRGTGCHVFEMTNSRDTNYYEVMRWGGAVCVVGLDSVTAHYTMTTCGAAAICLKPAIDTARSKR